MVTRTHLIEILLPTRDNSGTPFPPESFEHVRHELTDRFGGVTAFLRAPGVGLWQDTRGKVRADEIAIFEVMTDRLDSGWWRTYRMKLEDHFRQQEIVVRAIPFERV